MAHKLMTNNRWGKTRNIVRIEWFYDKIMIDDFNMVYLHEKNKLPEFCPNCENTEG